MRCTPTADAFTKTHNNEYTNLKSSLWKKILEATFFWQKNFRERNRTTNFWKSQGGYAQVDEEKSALLIDAKKSL